MNTLSVGDLNYIAGFMDGEGSFCINSHCRNTRRRRHTSYTPRVSVGNTDHGVLFWIQKVTGIGALQSKPIDNPKWKNQWHWYLRVEEIEEFTKAILPYLKIKQRQAGLLLEFLSLEKNPGGSTAKEDVQIQRQVIAEEIALLNKRGP